MEGLDLRQLSAMTKVIAEEKGLPEDTILEVVQMAIDRLRAFFERFFGIA